MTWDLLANAGKRILQGRCIGRVMRAVRSAQGERSFANTPFALSLSKGRMPRLPLKSARTKAAG
jgi:hypothetical protein